MKNKIPLMRKYILVIIFFCFSLVYSYAQNKKDISSYNLPVSTPEAEGVSSAGILQFLNAVDNGKNELHSFVLLRHGKIISEGWWSPYNKYFKHVMYSVSKSFTSMGVGIAIAENKLKISDRVISFFPNSLPDTIGAYMKDMTVEDLLKMATGMNIDPLFGAMGSSDWPKAFISSKVENKPGTVFKYNNMATFMLSAIVQKATGEKLVDYLKPRLFNPLGIKNFTWDDAPGGNTFGAIGLRLLSEDMAKFGQLLLQKGNWNGKQIIPSSWVGEATSFQIKSNAPENKTPAALNDWEQGYGYQFWRGRNNTYRADGLGGQFIIEIPDKDAVVVLTTAATNTQDELNLVWQYLIPAIKDKPIPEDKKANAALTKKIASLARLSLSSTTPLSSLQNISGKRIEVEENELGIKGLYISFKNRDAQIVFDRGTEQYEIKAGKDQWQFGQTKLNSLGSSPRPTQVFPNKVASKYTWTTATTIELTSRFVEESIRNEVWNIRFEKVGKEIKVHIEIKGFVEFMGIQTRKLEGKIMDDPLK